MVEENEIPRLHLALRAGADRGDRPQPGRLRLDRGGGRGPASERQQQKAPAPARPRLLRRGDGRPVRRPRECRRVRRCASPRPSPPASANRSRTALEESSLKDPATGGPRRADPRRGRRGARPNPEIAHAPLAPHPPPALRPHRAPRAHPDGWSLHFTGREATGAMMMLVLRRDRGDVFARIAAPRARRGPAVSRGPPAPRASSPPPPRPSG